MFLGLPGLLFSGSGLGGIDAAFFPLPHTMQRLCPPGSGWKTRSGRLCVTACWAVVTRPGQTPPAPVYRRSAGVGAARAGVGWAQGLLCSELAPEASCGTLWLRQEPPHPGGSNIVCCHQQVPAVQRGHLQQRAVPAGVCPAATVSLAGQGPGLGRWLRHLGGVPGMLAL